MAHLVHDDPRVLTEGVGDRCERPPQAVWRQAVRERRLLLFGDEPDIVIYPDSGKLGAFERRPDGTGLDVMFRLSDSVDYHDGERPPGES